MRVVTAGRIKEWYKIHSLIESALLRWLGTMEVLEDCATFDDLRKLFNTVDQVKVGSGKIVQVFNISHGKNAYRLIVAIHFNTQIAFVLRLLTHAEYDKENWKNEL
jgi:mRNA interferase HigB